MVLEACPEATHTAVRESNRVRRKWSISQKLHEVQIEFPWGVIVGKVQGKQAQVT